MLSSDVFDFTVILTLQSTWASVVGIVTGIRSRRSGVENSARGTDLPPPPTPSSLALRPTQLHIQWISELERQEREVNHLPSFSELSYTPATTICLLGVNRCNCTAPAVT